MNIMQNCLFLFWTFFIPLAAGGILPGDPSLPLWFVGSYVRGWILLFAAAEVITLPLIFLSASLSVLTGIFAAVSLLLAAVGAVCILKRRRTGGNTLIKQISADVQSVSPWTLLAAVLILAQIAMVCRYAYMDADDSFYLGMALTDVETNTLYTVNPYTGALYTAKTFQQRYLLSAFPELIAVLSRLSGAVNPILLAHKRLAAPLFTLAYAVLYRMAQRFFPQDKHSQGRFLLFAVFIVWYSAYSAYNREDFMMVRIWQGKGVLAGIMIPALLYYGITVCAAVHEQESWIMVFLTSAACCLTTMLGIVAAPVILGCCTLIGLAARIRAGKTAASGGQAEGVSIRSAWSLLLRYLICCLPCILLGLLYLNKVRPVL